MSTKRRVYNMLKKVKTQKPIVHCITNHVVSNFQANGLLALGASPIMGEAPEEAAELAALSNAVSLNIGTLNKQSLKSMVIAGQVANEQGIPVVLDPVGVGATSFRQAAVTSILAEVKVTVLRCNAGELAAIAGVDWQAKGVDAGEGNADIPELARLVAKQHNLTVAVTGETDIVTDGEKLFNVPFGNSAMASVTGTGCLLSAVVAAFLAVQPNHPVESTLAALRFYAIAGEQATNYAKLPGDFPAAFLNKLATIPESEINDIIRLKEETL